MTKDELGALASALAETSAEDQPEMSVDQIADEFQMLKVEVRDRGEFPIYITVDGEQILCTTYLFRENEIKPEKRNELLESMLTMNLPMPLSSFGKVGDQYLIFGAMASTSTVDDVRTEVLTLSDNTLGAVEALQPYLQ